MDERLPIFKFNKVRKSAKSAFTSAFLLLNIVVFKSCAFSKVIDLNEVVEQQIVNYDFVGYGIRKTKKYGTVYNVKGGEGVAIILTNGEKYLIGSQKTEEFLKSLLK